VFDDFRAHAEGTDSIKDRRLSELGRSTCRATPLVVRATPLKESTWFEAHTGRQIRLSQHRLQARRGMGRCRLSVTAGRGVPDMPQGKGTRRVYTVETDPKGGWRGEAKGSTRAVAKGDNKAEVVKRTIEVAKKQPKAQVRIKGRNGRIQQERTYPRRSPMRTPG
jgi:Uncharacterized protein conserved in bacteria (DUF2188)